VRVLNFQCVWGWFGDLVPSLRQKRVDLAQLRAGCGSHGCSLLIMPYAAAEKKFKKPPAAAVALWGRLPA